MSAIGFPPKKMWHKCKYLGNYFKLNNNGVLEFKNMIPASPHKKNIWIFRDITENTLQEIYLKDIIRKMLIIDPSARITAFKALEHPFFFPYLPTIPSISTTTITTIMTTITTQKTNINTSSTIRPLTTIK